MDIGDINGPLLVRTCGGKIALEKIRNLVMGNLRILFRLTTRDGTYVQKLHIAVNGLVG
jgi:hypothetical protein